MTSTTKTTKISSSKEREKLAIYGDTVQTDKKPVVVEDDAKKDKGDSKR